MPLTLYPYFSGNTWVFDDPRTGLKEEAFVLGSSEMIHRLVEAKRITNANEGFELQFSNEPFGHDVELDWLRRDDAGVLGADGSEAEIAGNWYGGEVMGQRMEGWLCPALFLYFQSAPKKIFINAQPLPAGVDPIWHVAFGQGGVRRFVSGEKDDAE